MGTVSSSVAGVSSACVGKLPDERGSVAWGGGVVETHVAFGARNAPSELLGPTGVLFGVLFVCVATAPSETCDASWRVSAGVEKLSASTPRVVAVDRVEFTAKLVCG